jgi:hypothetical protein
MASYPPAPTPAWIIAVRFLTLGIMAATCVLSIWWITRLADHIETQRQLLLNIQKDVLVNQSQVGAVLAVAEQTGRRLATVEARGENASDDRRQLRESDQKMIEALVRLRGDLDHIRENIDGPPPGRDGMASDSAPEPGPANRRRR